MKVFAIGKYANLYILEEIYADSIKVSTKIAIDVIISHNGGLKGMSPIIITGEVKGKRLKKIETPPVGLLNIGCKQMIAKISGIVIGSIN